MEMMSQRCFTGVQKHRYCVCCKYDTFQEKSIRIKCQLRKTPDVVPDGLYKPSMHPCTQAANRVGCNIKSQAGYRSLTCSLTWPAREQVGGHAEKQQLPQGFNKAAVKAARAPTSTSTSTNKQSSRFRHASSLFQRQSIFIVRQPLLVCALTSTSRPTTPPTSVQSPRFPA